MHEARRQRPAQYDADIDTARLGLGQPGHGAKVDLEVRMGGEKRRQRRHQPALDQEARRADHKSALRPVAGTHQQGVGAGELLEQRPAGVQVGVAIGRHHQPASVALDQRGAEAALERRHHLADGRHADLEATRRRRQAAFLGGGDEALQCAQLVHVASDREPA